MSDKGPLYAAAFSALLPGLGQLFSHRIVTGVGFFMIFATLLAIPTLRIGIPLLALLAALEAKTGHRSAPSASSGSAIRAVVPSDGRPAAQSAPSESGWLGAELAFLRRNAGYRLWSFFFVAIIGCLSWIFLLFPEMTTIGKQADLNDQADRVARLVYLYREQRGTTPYDTRDLGRAITVHETEMKDPWGNVFLIESADEGFWVRSAGPDGVMGTVDDLKYSFPDR